MAFSQVAEPVIPDPGVRDGERMLRLVEAARELANSSGSASFRVADVAERAGLSLKCFYHCFRGKDDLLLALLERDSRVGADVLAQRIGHQTGADAVHVYVRELLALAALPDAIGYAGVLVREHRRLEEHRPDELRAALAPLVDVLTTLVPPTSTRRDVETTFSLLLLALHEIVLGRVDDVDERADYLSRFCWRALEG